MILIIVPRADFGKEAAEIAYRLEIITTFPEPKETCFLMSQ
jgi:hypothetical protein